MSKFLAVNLKFETHFRSVSDSIEIFHYTKPSIQIERQNFLASKEQEGQEDEIYVKQRNMKVVCCMQNGLGIVNLQCRIL